MKRAPAVPMKVSFTSPPHLVGRSVLAPPHTVRRSVLARSATTGWGRSNLRHLRQGHLHLLPEIAVVQLLDAFERVDLLDRLVVADAHTAGEAKRDAAGLPVRPLASVATSASVSPVYALPTWTSWRTVGSNTAKV